MTDYFDQHIQDQKASASPKASTPSDSLPLSNDEADDGKTAPSLKAAVQELLKYGLVEQSAKPNIYRTLQTERSAVLQILEPFDFTAQIDDVRGLIFLKIAEHLSNDADEAWSHPLLRRLRLTLEQTLLVAILRQCFVAYEQECGIGAEDAKVDFEELLARFDLYLGDSGSEQKNQNRLSNVLEQLQKHGIVAAPDKENRIQIRPIIVHLANPEQLTILLAHFKKIAESHPASDLPTSDNSTKTNDV